MTALRNNHGDSFIKTERDKQFSLLFEHGSDGCSSHFGGLIN